MDNSDYDGAHEKPTFTFRSHGGRGSYISEVTLRWFYFNVRQDFWDGFPWNKETRSSNEFWEPEIPQPDGLVNFVAGLWDAPVEGVIGVADFIEYWGEGSLMNTLLASVARGVQGAELKRQLEDRYNSIIKSVEQGLWQGAEPDESVWPPDPREELILWPVQRELVNYVMELSYLALDGDVMNIAERFGFVDRYQTRKQKEAAMETYKTECGVRTTYEVIMAADKSWSKATAKTYWKRYLNGELSEAHARKIERVFETKPHLSGKKEINPPSSPLRVLRGYR